MVSVIVLWPDGKTTSGAAHALFINGTQKAGLPESACLLSGVSLSI